MLWTLKVKCMQIPGTEAIRTQIQPSNPKRDIPKITNSQNTRPKYKENKRVSSYFPKGGQLETQTKLKYYEHT